MTFTTNFYSLNNACHAAQQNTFFGWGRISSFDFNCCKNPCSRLLSNFLNINNKLNQINMKSIRKFFILAIAVSVIAIGCKKENQVTVSDNEINQQLKESEPNMRRLYTANVGGYAIPLFCAWPPVNCLPTVIIYANAIDGTNPKVEAIAEAYDSFISAIKNDNVDEFFESNQYITLFPQLSNFPTVLSGLRNAEIVIYQDVGDDGLEYYVCLPDTVNYMSDWSGQEECVFVIDNRTN
jgi:hypothetical protein